MKDGGLRINHSVSYTHLSQSVNQISHGRNKGNKKSRPSRDDLTLQQVYQGGAPMKRLQNIDINPSTGELDIDIMEQNSSFAIVVSNGKAKLTELPEHGEAKIVMHQGKVKRVKYDEGEEF